MGVGTKEGGSGAVRVVGVGWYQEECERKGENSGGADVGGKVKSLLGRVKGS